MIGTLDVDGWAVTFGTARRGLGGLRPRRPLRAVPNVTAHPSVASVPTSYYSMWRYNYFCTVDGWAVRLYSNSFLVKSLRLAAARLTRVATHNQQHFTMS